MPSYGVKEIHKAATFYRKRYLKHRETMNRKDSMLKATAETTAKLGDETLAKTVAIYVHADKLTGEWTIG